MLKKILLAALLLSLWPSTGSLDATELLTLSVTPAQSFAPVTLRVRVRMEASADNRSFELVADSIDFYRSSLLSLDGDRAPRVMVFEFKNVPAGEYELRATLRDAVGKDRASVRKQARVIPQAGEP